MFLYSKSDSFLRFQKNVERLHIIQYYNYIVSWIIQTGGKQLFETLITQE